MTAIGIVFLNVLLLVGGQLLWKLALTRQPLQSLDGLPQLMTHPFLWLGGLVYAAATIIWLFALSRYDLSRVYPLQSMAYVLGAFAGIWLFKESMTVHQWIGIGLIVGGACFLAK